jgi:hypothetical protein
MMAEAATPFRIFIASPSDCRAEREAVRHIASQDQAIRTLCRECNVALEVFGWEDLLPDLGRPQSLINAAIETFNPDWFVFIFWHRLGSDAGLGMTGSEEEWNLARQKHEEGGGRPWVSTYFNQADPPWHELDGLQFEALKRFRATIWANYQALTFHFRGTKAFEDTFRGHLTARLLDLSSERVAGRLSGVTRLRQEFFAASQGLLRRPRTLGANYQIERPELQQLLDCIHESESSTTLLLGRPGTGKSALLASLGHRLRAEPVTFLAIKADMLGSTVTTLEALQRDWLHLSVGPRDAIRALAEREPVVLLIDQLDAVSELLDRQSGRLNVLLNVIHSLAGTRGVHIIATSREFEYRHDVRLTSIEAERMTLQPPAWEQIVPLLEQAGHSPYSMAEPLRELLRTPLHLKLFLDVAAPGDVFESLQALLEQLWGQRVVNPGGPGDRRVLLEQLAQRMADEETLWLPAAAADDHPEARQALEQVEILTQVPSGQTLGFRHQTYYDFTLARAFARGTISLTEHVLQRQDGLFVRPTLLSSLHYLRGTSRPQYQQQLRRFMASSPRQHIRTLIVEFLGQQTDPDDVEVSVLLPMLDSPAEGPRVLSAIIGSPGWFRRLRHHSRLEQWMRKALEEAAHCVPFLTAAASFDRETVFNLLEECWCDDAAYDPLSLKVLLDLNAWTSRTVDIAARLVRRSAWWGTALLAELAESAPDLAPLVLRADLDRRVEEALQEQPPPEPALPPEADEQERLLQELAERRRQLAPLRRLIESEEKWPDMDILAQTAPQAFLDRIWPWFLDVVSRMADEEHPFLARYRDAGVSYHQFDGRQHPAPPVIRALLAALSAWPEQDPQGMINFMTDNMRADLMIVHRLIARGLERMAAQAPQHVLDYLLGDSRRLALGDAWDHHRESIRLIQAVCSHLSSNGLAQLEETVRSFTPYKRIMPEWPAEERLEHSKWARQDRLRLLRAFPADCLSVEGRRLRDEEERAFPEAHSEQGGFFEGAVGPRMTAHEMALASDDDLLRLFDELPDETEWDNPKRRWSEGFSRGGGAIQLSREFCQLAKQMPTRATKLIPRLQPGRHEHYAGAAVEGLAETEVQTSELVNLIDSLDQRGFSSGAFRDAAALALEGRANRDRGLPDGILLRLAGWLADHPDPPLPTSEVEQQEQGEQRGGPVLFADGSVALPGGRGYIVQALAAGHLARQTPDLEHWARVIESRLAHERHPVIWARTLHYMPMLFNGDRRRATGLYDAVIRTCPAVLQHIVALLAIARVIGQVEPREQVRGWLERLRTENATVCQQAYGELLVLSYSYHQESWTETQIRQQLSDVSEIAIVRGLAYAASYLWRNRSGQPIARDILCALASSNDASVQKAVAAVFRINQEDLELNAALRRVIEAVCASPAVLVESALNVVETLAPYASTEPALVSQVCQQVLTVIGPSISQVASSLSMLAEPMTNIALTLHRQDAYREVGLALFEQLLALNVQEARAALEVLDRPPMQRTSPRPVRRRRRPRSR